MKFLLTNLEVTIELIRLRIERRVKNDEPFEAIETNLIVYERLMVLYKKCEDEKH